MRTPIGIAALVALAFGGCGGDTDYLGKPPADAGADLGVAACDAAFDCGIISVSCDTMSAMAIREPAEHLYGTRDVCDTMLTTYYTDLLTGCAAANLTDAERDDVNACLNANPYCPDDSELQAVADAVCADNPPPGFSADCTRAQPLLSRCSACAANPTGC